MGASMKDRIAATRALLTRRSTFDEHAMILENQLAIMEALDRIERDGVPVRMDVEGR